MNLENYHAKGATHLLACAHAIGKSRREYFMKCTYLGISKNGKGKFVVFGERNWKDKEHVKQVKYLPFSRVQPIEKPKP